MDFRNWGSTAEERALAYPCDSEVSPHDDDYFRAVDVAAPPERVFRWLCQLRAAPYSYDWIDNFGRRSPPELTPGLEELAVGQTVMTIFTLRSFERDRHLTLKHVGGMFGEVAVSYMVWPRPGGARLLAKLRVRHARGLAGLVLTPLLAPGDWIMMRKQLLTLKALAERSGAAWK